MMEFRVSRTGGAKHVEGEFGVPVSQFGNLTPQQVNEAAKQAKVMQLQAKLTKAMVTHCESIYKNKAEIERLTLQAIESGLKSKEEIDRYVNKAIIAGAKHDASIQLLKSKLDNELNLVKGKLLSDTALATMSFQQKLRLMQANHGSQQQILINGFDQQLRAIQASPQLAIAAQNQSAQLDAYINARDFVPALGGGGSSQSSNSTRGGNFLNGLFNFFTGRN
jgi:hypothetical protein